MNKSLAWILDVITSTKESLVEENGIGSDLPPLVAAFDKYGDPIGQAQVSTSSESREDQFMRLVGVATLMRSGWQAEFIAIVLEGYMVINGHKDDEKPLAQRFADGDKNVVECISAVFASLDEVTVVSLPYVVGLGRKIEWMTAEQQIAPNAQAYGAYPRVLADLFVEVDPIKYPEAVPPEVAIMAIGAEIVDRGFFVVCQALDDSAQRWINEQ